MLEENKEPIDSLDIITRIRSEEPSGPAEKEPGSPAAEGAEPVAEGDKAEVQPAEAQPEEVDDGEARRMALLREIASDPGLTQQYLYQPKTQSKELLPEETPQLPFDDLTFDPNNPQHMQALLDARLQTHLREVGQPLFDRVDSLAQTLERQQAVQQQKQIETAKETANRKTIELLDTYVPGLNDTAQKVHAGTELDPIQEAIWHKAVNTESYYLNYFADQIAKEANVDYNTAYSYVVHNIEIRAEIAQQVGPEVKKYAKAIGAGNSAVPQPAQTVQQKLTQAQKQVMKQESYIESSNAVPASSGDGFEKALKKGDSLSMIAALRAS